MRKFRPLGVVLMQRRWKIVLIATTALLVLVGIIGGGVWFLRPKSPPALTDFAEDRMVTTSDASPVAAPPIHSRGISLSPSPNYTVNAAAEGKISRPVQSDSVQTPDNVTPSSAGNPAAGDATNATTAKDPLEDAIAHASLKSRADIHMETDMRLYKSYLVTFAIQAEKQDGSTMGLDNLGRKLPASSIMNTTIQSSREVSASLVTGDLEYVAQDAGWKTLVSTAPSIWTWTVTAKTPGEKTVLFNLEQRIKIGEKTIEVPVEQFPFIVKVRASFVGQVAAMFSTVQSAAVAIAAMLGTLGTIGTACYTAWRMVRWRTRKANSRPHLQP
ncbi:hypothetical protein [Rhizobium sp. SG741]|uniref:hypothetical protein n=1 Tax=Rhizobium sp. SG741 TaxID=2587114 RepID=UPI00144555DF|nr:hypothetical protein [Rhizobium sp. SG741]NKJ03490.1 hypothetical protein [Rhizobium sp. SG741]